VLRATAVAFLIRNAVGEGKEKEATARRQQGWITQLQHNQRISGSKFDKQPPQEQSQRNKWQSLE